MNKLSDKQWFYLVCVILTLVTLAAYGRLRNNDFINYDDPKYITDNYHVTGGITRQSIVWAFTESHFFMWHPVTSLSHMLDCQLFGLNPWRHHLMNLLFHIVSTLLLFGVLKQMTKKLWPSAFIAAAFALHPLNVESVAWAAERKSVLSAFFWMLTIAVYIRYAKRLSITNYILVVLVFCLALMSKPTTVTLPFALLLLDYWPLERFKNKTFYYLILEKIPFLILAAILCVITVLAQKGGGSLGGNQFFPLNLRVENALISYVSYIAKMIYPLHLAFFYPHPGFGISVWKAVVCLMLLLVISASMVYFGRRKPYLIVGWLWYLGTLVPVVGIVQSGAQAMADRYAYVPLIGLFTAIAFGINDILAGWKCRKTVLMVSASAVLAVWSVCTASQLRYWHDNASLSEHALEVTKNNYLAHNLLAYSFYIQGRLDDSIAQNNEALKINPYYPLIHNGIGLALLQKGKLDEAVGYFNQATQIKPDFADARSNLGYTLFLQGKFQQAAEVLADALALNSDSVKVRTRYVQALMAGGMVYEVVKQLKVLVRSSTDWATANNLAWILAVYKGAEFYDPLEAIRLAKATCKVTDYKNSVTLDTLAVGYAAAGDFANAVTAAEKALTLAQSEGNKKMANDILQHLDLFKTGHSYVEPVPK